LFFNKFIPLPRLGFYFLFIFASSEAWTRVYGLFLIFVMAGIGSAVRLASPVPWGGQTLKQASIRFGLK
jgi:hypothetical protein